MRFRSGFVAGFHSLTVFLSLVTGAFLHGNCPATQLHPSFHIVDDICHSNFGSGPVDANGSDEQAHSLLLNRIHLFNRSAML